MKQISEARSEIENDGPSMRRILSAARGVSECTKTAVVAVQNSRYIPVRNNCVKDQNHKRNAHLF